MNFTSDYLIDLIKRFDLLNPQSYTNLDNYLVKNYKELTVEELFPEMFRLLEEEEKQKMNAALEKLTRIDNSAAALAEEDLQ